MRRRISRPWRLRAVLLVVGVGLAGVQVLATTPASAAAGLQTVTGIQKVSSPLIGPNSQDKTARATCPDGKRVISGGGIAQASAADQTKVQLTQLQPVHPTSGPDFFEVSANEVSPGITSNWTLLMFAICADPISGLHIVSAPSFNRAQSMQALCPVGEVTLGGGGRIDTSLGHIGISMASPTDFDGSRFQLDVSIDDFVAFNGDWTLTAYAVCAPRPPGFQIVVTSSTQPPNAPVKAAFVDCPSNKRLHGIGAVTFFNTGQRGVGLQSASANNEMTRAAASGGPAGPVTVPDWGPVRPVAICAT